MPRWADARTKEGTFAAARRRVHLNRVRVAQVELDVFDREGDRAAVVETRELDEILIDPTGEHPRALLSASHEGDFREAAEDAVPLPVRLTAHRAQLEALLDRDHKMVAVFSGARAGKTHMMAIRCAIGWLEIGGPGIHIGWLAPTRKHTRLAVEKLVIGTPDTPPIFPPGVVVSYPRSEASADQTIRLIDGTQIHLLHGTGDGSNIRGWEFHLLLVDEITAIKDAANFDVAVGRTGRTGGQVFIGSTPINNHWAKTKILDLQTRHIANYRYTCWDNPWFPESEIWIWLESLGGDRDKLPDQQPPLVQREGFGMWARDGVMAFPEFDRDVHVHPIPDMANVTPTATAKHWRNPSHVGVGQDFNDRGHAAVVCTVRADDPTNWRNWHFCFHAEVVTPGYVEDQAVALQAHLREHWGTETCPVACDATGAGRSDDGSVTGDSQRSGAEAAILQSYGFDALAPHYRRSKSGEVSAENPLQKNSLSLLNWLFRRGQIHVDPECEVLIQGLSDLQRKEDGRIDKISAPHSTSDIISDPVDAARYFVWACIGKRWLREIRDSGPRETPD